MANTKISALASGNPAQSGDLIPIDRSGSNFSLTAASIAALAYTNSGTYTGANFQASSTGNATTPAFFYDEGVNGKSGFFVNTTDAEVDFVVRGTTYYRMAFNKFFPNNDNAIPLGDKDFFRWQYSAFVDGYTTTMHFGTANAYGPIDTSGAGSPEGAVTAVVGSTYRRTDGGAATSFYVKESGTGNTGWVGK